MGEVPCIIAAEWCQRQRRLPAGGIVRALGNVDMQSMRIPVGLPVMTSTAMNPNGHFTMIPSIHGLLVDGDAYNAYTGALPLHMSSMYHRVGIVATANNGVSVMDVTTTPYRPTAVLNTGAASISNGDYFTVVFPSAAERDAQQGATRVKVHKHLKDSSVLWGGLLATRKLNKQIVDSIGTRIEREVDITDAVHPHLRERSMRLLAAAARCMEQVRGDPGALAAFTAYTGHLGNAQVAGPTNAQIARLWSTAATRTAMSALLDEAHDINTLLTAGNVFMSTGGAQQNTVPTAHSMTAIMLSM